MTPVPCEAMPGVHEAAARHSAETLAMLICLSANLRRDAQELRRRAERIDQLREGLERALSR